MSQKVRNDYYVIIVVDKDNFVYYYGETGNLEANISGAKVYKRKCFADKVLDTLKSTATGELAEMRMFICLESDVQFFVKTLREKGVDEAIDAYNTDGTSARFNEKERKQIEKRSRICNIQMPSFK